MASHLFGLRTRITRENLTNWRLLIKSTWAMMVVSGLNLKQKQVRPLVKLVPSPFFGSCDQKRGPRYPGHELKKP